MVAYVEKDLKEMNALTMLLIATKIKLSVASMEDVIQLEAVNVIQDSQVMIVNSNNPLVNPKLLHVQEMVNAQKKMAVSVNLVSQEKNVTSLNSTVTTQDLIVPIEEFAYQEVENVDVQDYSVEMNVKLLSLDV